MHGKITLPIHPQPDLKACKVEFRPSGFDPHTGPSYVVSFYGKTGIVVAREHWTMKKEDWQEWGRFDTEEEDEDFLLSRIVYDMKLVLGLQDPINITNQQPETDYGKEQT